ncbi:unnamed protein product, partial [Closterium sp. NIES-53]
MRSMRAPIMRRSAIMSPNTDQGIFRQEILRSPALSRRILRSPALPREILRSPALSREILRSPALSRRILRKLVAPSRWKRRLSTQRAESPVSALAIAPSSRQLRLLRRRLSFGNAFRAPFVMSRRGFPLVPPSSAVLVVLLLVAAAAGGVRGLRGNAAHPRKLAVGGSGDSSRRRTAELVKESSHASAMGGAHIPPLQLILAEEGRAEGAVCLDGSAPGFYYRKGYGSGQNNWVLFFEGGAWCSSPHACAYRARMHLGSTKHARSVGEMLDRQNGSMHGMLSSNHTVNPDFYNWNAVYFIYCDGGSFSGHQDQPVRFNGIPLYMRGRKVADLLVKHLMEKKGLGHAEKVVVSGSSAGGVALLLHCDRVKDTLTAASPHMHVRCLADASMFLDIPDSDKNRRIAAFFSEVQTMHNLTISLPPACVKDRALEQHHQCFMANHILQHVSTPLFLINSNYDKVAMRAITQPQVLDSGLTAPPDCFDHLSTCTAKEKHIFEALPSLPCTPCLTFPCPPCFTLPYPSCLLALPCNPLYSLPLFPHPPCLAVPHLPFPTLPHLSPPCPTFLHLASPCFTVPHSWVSDYRKAVANAVAPLVHSAPKNAVFLFSCFQHGSIHSDVPWMMRTAKGV